LQQAAVRGQEAVDAGWKVAGQAACWAGGDLT